MSGGLVELIGPGVNHRMLVDIIHGSHDAILEFVFARDANVTQDRAGQLGKEPIDNVQPRTVLGYEGEFEASCCLLSEPGFGLLGDMRGVIVEDHLDRGMGRIGCVDQLEKFDEGRDRAVAKALSTQR